MPRLLLSVLLSLVPAFLDAAVPSECQPVQWISTKEFIIHGVYCAPSASSNKVWVLMHGLGATKHEWEPLMPYILKSGQGVLVFDARGHGDSLKTTQSQEVRYQQFQTKEAWEKVVDDFSSAVNWVRTKNPSATVCVGGASLGANAALIVASKDSRIPKVFALSSGVSYAGLEPDEAIGKLKGRSVLLVAAPGDDYVFQSLQRFVTLHPEVNAFAAPRGAGHGVNMLKEPLVSKIIQWMKEK